MSDQVEATCKHLGVRINAQLKYAIKKTKKQEGSGVY